MKSVRVKAFAKLNLRLEVIGRLTSGYHNIETIFQQVSLHDNITIKKSDDFKITCDNPNVPVDETNTVYKAWRFMGAREPVHIHIEKNIPIGSGLGGESADAAAVLKGLNELWNLNLTDDELMQMGSKIAKDVPFCLFGGTAIRIGRNNVIKGLPFLGDLQVMICVPRFGAYPTSEQVYSISRSNVNTSSITDDVLKPLYKKDFTTMAGKHLVNNFEKVVFPHYPILQVLKEKMTAYGALGSLMSGHGPCVYGLFLNIESAEKVKEKLIFDCPDILLCRTV